MENKRLIIYQLIKAIDTANRELRTLYTTDKELAGTTCPVEVSIDYDLLLQTLSTIK